MATYIRAQLTSFDAGAPTRDRVVNVLHFKQKGAVQLLGTDWDALATDLCTIWRSEPSLFAGTTTVECRLYDMEEPAPRAPKAIKTKTLATLALGCPREVAICLSYASDLYGPNGKGRVYIGPLTSAGVRPSGSQSDAVIRLPQQLADVGGTDMEWSVYSPTRHQRMSSIDEGFNKVSHAWQDDEYDIQRSRGQRPTTRRTWTGEG